MRVNRICLNRHRPRVLIMACLLHLNLNNDCVVLIKSNPFISLFFPITFRLILFHDRAFSLPLEYIVQCVSVNWMRALFILSDILVAPEVNFLKSYQNNSFLAIRIWNCYFKDISPILTNQRLNWNNWAQNKKCWPRTVKFGLNSVILC